MNCVQNDLVEFSGYVFMACFKWGERSSLYLQCYFQMLALALDTQQCMMVRQTGGIFCMYCHLQKVQVKKEDPVM